MAWGSMSDVQAAKQVLDIEITEFLLGQGVESRTDWDWLLQSQCRMLERIVSTLQLRLSRCDCCVDLDSIS
jgi:hypothetical protein